MASLLLDIATFLVDKELAEGDGVDIFRDYIPDEPNDIITLYEYLGDPVNPYTDVVHRSVQVKVRNSDADTARLKALEIFKALNTENRMIQFTDTRLGQVYLRQSPMKIETDGKTRTTYGFNMGITTDIE